MIKRLSSLPLLHSIRLPVSLACVLMAPSAGAVTFFSAIMTPDQEPPPPVRVSTALGTASFVLNDAQTELSMIATFTGIDIDGTQTPLDDQDNLMNAHIHAPAPPGANGGVRWGFFGSPDNDNNPDDLVVTPLANGVGGTITSVWNAPEGNGGTTLTEQLPNIFAGLSYINFHTVRYPGGEIRGQIQLLPDTGSTALLLALGAPAALMVRSSLRRRG